VRLGVLVGVGGLRRLGCPQAVDDRLPSSTHLSRLEVVMRELRRMDRQRGRFQRYRQAPVEAQASARDGPLVQRLAHKRMSEREAVDFIGILVDHPCCHSGLQCRDDLVLSLLQSDRLQRRQAEVVSQHGGERQDLERCRGRFDRVAARVGARRLEDRRRRPGSGAERPLDCARDRRSLG